MKRIISLLLCFVMTVLLLPASFAASSPRFEINSPTVNYDGGRVKVTVRVVDAERITGLRFWFRFDERLKLISASYPENAPAGSVSLSDPDSAYTAQNGVSYVWSNGTAPLNGSADLVTFTLEVPARSDVGTKFDLTVVPDNNNNINFDLEKIEFDTVSSAVTVVESQRHPICVDSADINTNARSVTLGVTLGDVADLTSFSVRLVYPAVLTFKSAKLAEGISGNISMSDPVDLGDNTSEITLVWVNGIVGYSGDVRVFETEFALPEGIEKGDDFTVSSKIDDVDNTFDMEYHTVFLDPGEGTVSVKAIAADTSGDNNITLRDVGMMIRALAGWIQKNYVAAAQDYNGDGKFNSRDVAMLMRDIASGRFS